MGSQARCETEEMERGRERREERWFGIRKRRWRKGDVGKRLNGMFMGDGSWEMGGVRWKESYQ